MKHDHPRDSRPLRPRARLATALAVAWGVASAEEPPQAPSPAPSPPPPPTSTVTAAPPGPEAATRAPASVPATREGAYAEFRRLFDAKRYEEAAALAKQVVELTPPDPAAGSEDLQVALINLANAQYLAEDYVGAEASYLRLIEIVEASGRMTNPRLGRAVGGLAQTYHAGKRHDLAVASYERAIALSRRNDGLFSEEQLPLLENYADSLTALDRVPDALQARRYALRIVERKHGPGSLRYAEALESIGRWYARVGAYDTSRQSLRRAIAIIETAQGPASAELVGPLTAFADCARRQLVDPTQQFSQSVDEERRAMFHDAMMPPPPAASPAMIANDGQKALERAAAIASGRPDPVPAQVADVRTQLGDWYQARQQHERALPEYVQAWQAASRAESAGKPLTELLFGRPVLLIHKWPEYWDRYADRPPTEAELRNVEIEATVDARGQVVNPKVVADAGDPKLGAQGLRAAASARYRPRFANGEPVATDGVRFLQPFYVLLPPPAPASVESPPAG